MREPSQYTNPVDPLAVAYLVVNWQIKGVLTVTPRRACRHATLFLAKSFQITSPEGSFQVRYRFPFWGSPSLRPPIWEMRAAS